MKGEAPTLKTQVQIFTVLLDLCQHRYCNIANQRKTINVNNSIIKLMPAKTNMTSTTKLRTNLPTAKAVSCMRNWLKTHCTVRCPLPSIFLRVSEANMALNFNEAGKGLVTQRAL